MTAAAATRGNAGKGNKPPKSRRATRQRAVKRGEKLVWYLARVFTYTCGMLGGSHLPPDLKRRLETDVQVSYRLGRLAAALPGTGGNSDVPLAYGTHSPNRTG